MPRSRYSLSLRTKGAKKNPSPPQSIKYPIAISAEKIEHAIELYEKLKYAEELEEQDRLQRPAHEFLTVPNGPSAPASVRSVTTSAYDARTDISSVVSFDGVESPSSKARGQGEFLNYNLKAVKTHSRNKLSPLAKAKAEFKRYLGACAVCRERKVPCPLSHHDVDSLERLRIVRQNEPPHNSQSSHSSTSQRTTTSIPPGQQLTSGPSQTDALLQIGQVGAGLENGSQFQVPEYEKTLDMMDIQSPSDNYDPQHPIAAPITMYQHTAQDVLLADPVLPPPTEPHQHGAMFRIGVLRGGFWTCQVCNELTNTDEELQVHFERRHFPYTRINPAYRYECSSCNHISDSFFTTTCSLCLGLNVEPWIYGSYIIDPPFKPDSSDVDDMNFYDSSSAPFDQDPYSSSNYGSQYNPNMSNGHSNGYRNDSYSYNGGSNYGGPSSQGYGYDPGPSHGSNLGFQNETFGARQMGMISVEAVHTLYITLQHRRRQHQALFLLISLLTLVTFGIFSPIPITSLAFADYLPTLGLVGMVASFVVGLKAKHRARKRNKCPLPLHAFSSSSLSTWCSQPPDIFISDVCVL